VDEGLPSRSIIVTESGRNLRCSEYAVAACIKIASRRVYCWLSNVDSHYIGFHLVKLNRREIETILRRSVISSFTDRAMCTALDKETRGASAFVTLGAESLTPDIREVGLTF
jgi:hypothetical protein